MDNAGLWEDTEEGIRNAINVLQLLAVGLADNHDDPHIIRSVGIAEGMLQATLESLQRLRTGQGLS